MAGGVENTDMAPNMAPEPKQLCDDLLSRFPAAVHGPAGLVVCDYFLDDDRVNQGLAAAAACQNGRAWGGRVVPTDELSATIVTLCRLRLIPEPERVGWYQDDGGEEDV
jgi:hypothetical protein